jgi:hypothetical protein
MENEAYPRCHENLDKPGACSLIHFVDEVFNSLTSFATDIVRESRTAR